MRAAVRRSPRRRSAPNSSIGYESYEWCGRGPLQLTGRTTPHDAIVGNKGFGETVRSINGALECDGKNPDERDDRINLHRQFVGTLGTDVGGGSISC
ncbi:hypothetical protein [Kitasatospora sp. NPDC086791]|uniref:hypothetical protein n=1 Tax=Kitasatospora sp. NPDC086791 TaxID=3155178 RepID=UPI0034198159